MVRKAVPDGAEVPFPRFTNLGGYMNGMTVSIRRNRWYFEHLWDSQWAPNWNSTLGYAPASFNINSGPEADHFEFGPIAPVQLASNAFQVTISARNTSNDIINSY